MLDFLFLMNFISFLDLLNNPYIYFLYVSLRKFFLLIINIEMNDKSGGGA